MTVETATTIATLNASYPAAGDGQVEGDDHIRMVKNVLKTHFGRLDNAAHYFRFIGQTSGSMIPGGGGPQNHGIICWNGSTPGSNNVALVGNGDWIIIVNTGSADYTLTAGGVWSTFNGSSTYVIRPNHAVLLTGADLNNADMKVFRLPMFGKDLVNTSTANSIPVRDSGGSITATSFIPTSDEELKENDVPLEGSLAKITALVPKRFRWKHMPQNIKKQWNKPDFGLMAQDVQALFPECVEEIEGSDLNGRPLKGVNYMKLVAPLIGAVRELTDRVAALEAKVP